MSEDGIVRRRLGYSAIPNRIFSDTRLSIEARGLLALLMSCGETWTFRASNLKRQCGCGAEKYQRMIREIKEAGYLVVTPRRKDDGTLSGYEYEIIDDPDNPESRSAGNPVSGKPDHLRKTTQEEEQEERTPIPPEGDNDLFGAIPSKQNEQPESKEERSLGLEEKFKEFYRVFPKKVAPDAAKRNFLRAVKAGADPDDIIAGAERYAKHVQAKGTERGYIKNPQGWLTDKRWEEEFEESRPASFYRPAPRWDEDRIER